MSNLLLDLLAWLLRLGLGFCLLPWCWARITELMCNRVTCRADVGVDFPLRVLLHARLGVFVEVGVAPTSGIAN